MLYGAWLAYAVSWLLPTVEPPADLKVGLPGWAAFRVACSPVWPYKGIEVEGYWAVLSVMSALTNALMIASPLVLLRNLRHTVRVFRYAAICALMLNAQWPLSFGSLEGLRAGYFVWWGSFGLLAISMHVNGAAEPTAARGLTTA